MTDLDRLDAPITTNANFWRGEYVRASEERDAAVRERDELREALTDARRLLKARAEDLSWCQKDDDCNVQARGASLALSDFDVATYAALHREAGA